MDHTAKSRPSLHIRDAMNTPLPPSSPYPHSPGRPTPTLQRSSSAMSLGRAPSSPALARKSSQNSLRNSPVSSPKLSSRRSSSNMFNMALPAAVEEPPPLTPEIIANNHFQEELALHQSETTEQTKTLVLLHDSCYGHRFSRPKTKQADLNLIVERPERVRAGVMGISAAYVRLGERHAGGQHPPHPKMRPSAQLPFKIQKTSRSVPLTSPPAVAVHGLSLMKEIQNMCQNAATKLNSTGHEVERDSESKRPLHTGDLYLCKDSLDAMQGALGGVLDAVDAVFTPSNTSNAFVCIRPPGHHCSSDFPSGFCWLNNVHVGIQHAIQQHGLTHVAIIDFDLHHGDGSQEIAWAHNEQMFYPTKPTPLAKRPFIGYYSLHDINSFPCEGGDREKVQMASLCVDNAHGQSIWNEHLKPWKTEDEFWKLYETKYVILLEKARNFLKQQTEERLKARGNSKPKAAIFISAGFDASEHEGGGMQRHKVNVPTEFYARFTKDILALAQEPGTSVDGRVISVLEGGYSNRALISGILSHLSGLCSTLESEEDEASLINGMAGMGLSGLAPTISAPRTNTVQYSKNWWEIENLELLEHLLDPHQPVPVSSGAKKARLATFASPTQSSTLRAVDPTKINLAYRSVSMSRPVTPPPPEVEWDVSASELCQILLPTDRDTRSHTGISLSEPKPKKEKPVPVEQEVPPPPATGGRARALRDRKVKATSPTTEQPKATRKSSIDRRKTIAEALPKPEPIETKEPRRRLSVASTISTASTAAPARTKSTKPVSGSSNGSGIEIRKTRRASSQGATAQPPAPPQNVPAVPPLPQQASNPAPKDDAMDELTSNIKRITIKVPSSEEYAARPKKPTPPVSKPPVPAVGPRSSSTTANTKKIPVPKPATSRHNSATTKKPSSSSASKIIISTKPSSQMSAASPKSTGQPIQQPAAIQPRPVTSPTSASESTIVDSQRDSSVTPSLDSVTSDGAQHSLAPTEWIHEAPETKQAAAVQGHSYDQIQWMQPNSDLLNAGKEKRGGSTGTSTTNGPVPVPVPERRMPPAFSATGHIPFAQPGAGLEGKKND